MIADIRPSGPLPSAFRAQRAFASELSPTLPSPAVFVGADGERGGMTTTLTANAPEDLLAAVPVVLGFHPWE